MRAAVSALYNLLPHYSDDGTWHQACSLYSKAAHGISVRASTTRARESAYSRWSLDYLRHTLKGSAHRL